MRVVDAIAAIIDTNCMSIPKSQFSLERVIYAFGSVCGETRTSWHVRCTHRLYKPATPAEIKEAESHLGFAIPDQYVEFLSLSNGAELFVVPQVWLKDNFPHAEHVRHRLFGTQTLVEINHLLLSIFRGNLGNDPEFKSILKLNYLAICDATDDNYQAILLDPGMPNLIFLLSCELMGRPYSKLDTDYYYMLADSFQDWLSLIVESQGWAGRGDHPGGL